MGIVLGMSTCSKIIQPCTGDGAVVSSGERWSEERRLLKMPKENIDIENKLRFDIGGQNTGVSVMFHIFFVN